MSIRAISFDLWDTLVVDDSDEPKRRAQGLLSKKEQRRYDVWEALNEQEPIKQQTVTRAYDIAEVEFNRVWHEEHVTWSVRERLAAVLKEIGRDLPEDSFLDLVAQHGSMEVEIPPDPVPGVKETLGKLREKYRLCVVSDAIVTPGHGLRRILELHGLARFFETFVFSDEIGHSKPHHSVFDAAARGLRVDLQDMIHIGDRQHNDVAGPKRLGMKAILFTAARDRDREGNTADAVCEGYANLPAVIERLAAPDDEP